MTIKQDLKKLADPKRAKSSQGFFKTGPGEYGQGDIFWGIRVPEQREVAKKYKDLPLKEVEKLLQDKVHEVRLTALFILRYQFKTNPDEVYKIYMRNAKKCNNWDLVDSSAPYISGPYLLDKDRKVLYKFAKSKNLWEKRIAIISTFAFIRENDFGDALKLAEILLNDEHDLMHKAIGWMLREVGNRNLAVEEKFLKKHYQKMPRTMLRYAIEKFSPSKKRFYMKKPVAKN